MNEHPNLAELSALLSEELTPRREREILIHLMFDCNLCLSLAPSNIRTLLNFEANLAEASKERTETDAAIDRAIQIALQHQKNLERERKGARKAEEILAQGGLEATMSLPFKLGTLAKMEALLARSWALRHDNPRLMVQFAILAAECSELLDARTFEVERVFDFKCRAQAELGNAFRIIDKYDQAEATLSQARRYFELGSRNEILEIHLLNLEASLDSDLLRFKEADVRMVKIYRYHCKNRDLHLAGRALVKQGLFAGYSGDPSRALSLLAQSIEMIDPNRDPGLVYYARHNQINFLVDLEQFREAEKRLFLIRSIQHHSGGKINQLRLRCLEGHIETGLNRIQRAESIFRQLSTDFLEANRAYDSALASLDLAAVLLAQRKAREATEVVTAASKIFIALRVDREAFMTVIMLRTACEMQLATQTMVERVAKFLRRLANDPSARFES